MKKRGSYHGGSTVLGPRSGWFSFAKDKKKKRKTRRKNKTKEIALEAGKAGPPNEPEPADLNSDPKLDDGLTKAPQKTKTSRVTSDPRLAEMYRERIRRRMASVQVIVKRKNNTLRKPKDSE